MIHKCWDCNGKGKKEYYSHIENGICYTCNGSGKTNFTTKEEQKQETCKHNKLGKKLMNMNSNTLSFWAECKLCGKMVDVK